MKKLFTLIFTLIFSVSIYSQQIIELCPQSPTQFEYSSNAGESGTYNWIFNNTITQGSEFTATFNSEGLYTLSLFFVSSNGCSSDTIYYTITVIPCEDTYLFLPNAFSPNNDGLNDLFGPIGVNYKNMKMWIFNRWGEQLFEDSKMWDGSYNGKLCQQDVYVYRIQWESSDGKFHKQIGRVTIVK